MSPQTVARRIATLIQSVRNCEESGNVEWRDRHSDTLHTLVLNALPSGGGFDNGTRLDQRSNPERLVFNTAFHHMDESGSYAGWTHHTVTVRASLVFGIMLTISGRNRNDIKDYIADVFHTALTAEVA
jgi:hypothetical protein